MIEATQTQIQDLQSCKERLRDLELLADCMYEALLQNNVEFAMTDEEEHILYGTANDTPNHY